MFLFRVIISRFLCQFKVSFDNVLNIFEHQGRPLLPVLLGVLIEGFCRPFF